MKIQIDINHKKYTEQTFWVAPFRRTCFTTSIFPLLPPTRKAGPLWKTSTMLALIITVRPFLQIKFKSKNEKNIACYRGGCNTIQPKDQTIGWACFNSHQNEYFSWFCDVHVDNETSMISSLFLSSSIQASLWLA